MKSLRPLEYVFSHQVLKYLRSILIDVERIARIAFNRHDASPNRSGQRHRRGIKAILHLLPVGGVRALPAGHPLLHPEMAVGHVGGEPYVHARLRSQLWHVDRGGQKLQEEDPHRLHAQAYQGGLAPVAKRVDHAA